LNFLAQKIHTLIASHFQILKSLFEKNSQFWLEQLVRLGIVDKVEQLASPKNAPVDSIPPIDSILKSDSTEQAPADIFAHEPMDVSPAPSAASSILRSATSTPSIGLVSSESLRSQASGGTTPETNVYSERLRMLNVPIHVSSFGILFLTLCLWVISSIRKSS
jgi:hypothetical protein